MDIRFNFFLLFIDKYNYFMKLTDTILKELVLKTLKEAKESNGKKGALVSVKAGKKPTTVQVKPTFKKKTTAPKVSASDPFDIKAKDNALDKFDKAPKTAAKVSITGTKSINKTTGANKGTFSKTAPKEKKDKPIAKPAFVVKESYSKKDLAKFIYEQAKKSLK